MNSLAPAVVKVALPTAVEKQMKLFRADFIRCPKEYIEFHLDLAEKRLAVLKSVYGFRVVETKLKDAGWFDGMQELNAIVETKRGALHKLVWCDSNQDFMLKYTAGQGSFNMDEVLGDIKPTGIAAITF